MVEKQRLFFNTWYKNNTRLTGRSTKEVEEEAIEWAREGLMTIKDMLTGEGKMILEVIFKNRHPNLKVSTYREMKKEMKEEWHAVLSRGY